MTTYIGKSGQRWYEIERGEHWVTLRPEYPTGRADQCVHMPIRMLEACGFREIADWVQAKKDTNP